jgi:beta propeller repeat protein
LAGGTVNFEWNGRTQSGASVEPGWYTVKVTLTDGLGRTTSAIRLVQVGDLLPDNQRLVDVVDGNQEEAHGRGRWVVWQDQRSGGWNIYARDVFDSAASEVVVTTGALNQQRPRTDGEYVVWQARQADGNWDVWAKSLQTDDPAFAVTQSADQDESNPVIEWPWVVYQSRPVIDPSSPWQLYVKNLLTNEVEVVDATTQDQLDPEIEGQRVVWQDYRDVGPGEIYLKDLTGDTVQRITNHPGGQYHPVIENQWIVWADNRDQQFDLYGYNLLRGVEVQLTSTSEDETRPRLNDHWVIFEEDRSGERQINLRLLSLNNLAAVQLTNAASEKEKPVLVSGQAVWTERLEGRAEVRIGALTDLQPVFNNRNMVVVTEGLLAYKQQAGDLLRLWQAEAGVVEITRFSQLFPSVVSETISWDAGGIVGQDFILSAGDFLWVRFNDAHILDLSDTACATHDLVAGVNVLSGHCFPDKYSAYQIIRDISLENINSVRTLDSETGHWRIASVVDGRIIGEDFAIANVAVLLLDMAQGVSGWKP